LYLAPRGITVTRLAAAAGLSRKHVSDIIHGRAGITAETAVRLGRVFGTSAGLWLGLQSDVDLYDAERAVPPAAVQPLAPAEGTGTGDEAAG
jgi:addiction module HigA family antidote